MRRGAAWIRKMPGAFSIPMRLDPSRAADGATAPGRARALRLCGWRPRPPRDTAASRDAPIDAASPEGVDEDEAAPSLHHRLREQTGSLLQMSGDMHARRQAGSNTVLGRPEEEPVSLHDVQTRAPPGGHARHGGQRVRVPRRLEFGTY